MQNRTLNARPSWATMALAQLRMVGLLQRRDLLVLGAIVTALIGLSVWGYLRMPDEYGSADTLAIFQGIAFPLALVGALWPLGVWRLESPDRRGYFWSLPVDRRQHTLLRVGVGWVILMVVSLSLMGLAVVAVAPAAIRYEELSLDLSLPWVALLTPTLGYLAVSAFAVAFESPVRAFAWTWMAVLGVFLAAEIGDLDGLGEWIEDVTGSFFAALGGPNFAPRNAMGTWARYYAIWFGLSAAALFAAVLRYQDER